MIRTTLITAALLASLSATPALADTQSKGEQRQHHSAQRFEYIFDQMNLGEQQREEVVAIMRDYAQERREHWREQRSERRAERHTEGEDSPRRARGERPSEEQMQAMHERREQAREQRRAELGARLNQVLAADQVKQLMTYMEAHRPKHRGQGPRKGDDRSSRGTREERRQ